VSCSLGISRGQSSDLYGGGASRLEALSRELTAEGAVDLRGWALLAAEYATGDLQLVLNALAEGASELAEAISFSSDSDQAVLRQRCDLILMHWAAVMAILEADHNPGPPEDYDEAFTMVDAVAENIALRGGALASIAREVLVAGAEKQSRNYVLWTPSERKLWREVVHAAKMMESKERADNNKRAKWARRKKGYQIGDIGNRPKRELPESTTSLKRSKEEAGKLRERFKRTGIGRSPRPEATEESKQQWEYRGRGRAEHGGKQMHATWVQLLGMIEAKKARVGWDGASS
jgi:hypothetical protein